MIHEHSEPGDVTPSERPDVPSIDVETIELDEALRFAPERPLGAIGLDSAAAPAVGRYENPFAVGTKAYRNRQAKIRARIREDQKRDNQQ